MLKPSEVAPVNAFILAEIMDDIGFPAGVFNLVSGLARSPAKRWPPHPDVDMVSFTGSTRAGKQVAELVAASVKKVALELGGKSPFVILDDADFSPRWPLESTRYRISVRLRRSARDARPAARLAEVEQLAAGAPSRTWSATPSPSAPNSVP